MSILHWGPAAVLCLGLLAGIIYAIARKTDHGFMKTYTGLDICWKPGTRISVYFDQALPSTYIAAYRTIAIEMNQIVGYRMFDLGAVWLLNEHPIKQPDAVPTNAMYITDAEIGRLGGTNSYIHHGKTGQLKSCYIVLASGMTDEVLRTTMRHEVGGHGLGLRHDDNLSIMAATLNGRPAHFTDKDKARLVKKYGSGLQTVSGRFAH